MGPKAKKQKTVALTTTTTTTTVIASTSTSSSSTTPIPAIPSAPVFMSALEARRQLMAVAAQKPSTPAQEESSNDPELSDGLVTDEGEEIQSAESGNEEGSDEEGSSPSSSSDDDDQEEEDQGKTSKGVKGSLSQRAAPAVQAPKAREERILYMDPQSVSTFNPSTTNVVYSAAKNLALVGLTQDETIVFKGLCHVTPLIGYATCMGYILSGTVDRHLSERSKNKQRNQQQRYDPTDLDFEAVQTFPIFSPSTHALAVIQSVCVPNRQAQRKIFTTVPIPVSGEQQQEHHALAREIAYLFQQFKEYQGFDTILAIHSALDTGIVGIEKVVPKFKGIFTVKKTPKKYSRETKALNSNPGSGGSELEEGRNMTQFETIVPGFHPILETMGGVAALKVPFSWLTAIDVLLKATEDERGKRVQRPPVAVVCGGKKMGKSTFSRLLLNRMLNRYRKVAFLECDIGQTEFTPLGMVALHIIDRPALGAPFTHLRQPRRAFFVGNSTPKDDPDYYSACLRELVRTYYEEVSHTRNWDDDDDYHSDDGTEEGENHVPLIVNTQGWIKGMGYDLLLQLLDVVVPSHIFGLHSPSSGDSNLPDSFMGNLHDQAHLAGRTLVPVFYKVEAVVLAGGGDHFSNNLSPFTKFHPGDHRDLALLSYFYQVAQKEEALPRSRWDFSEALIVQRPWCWDWRNAKGIWILFNQVPPSQVLNALNASLVALTGDVEREGEEATSTTTATTTTTTVASGSEEAHSSPTPSATTTAQENNHHDNSSLTLPKYYPIGQYPPPPPELTTCHGLAIIRSIQPTTHTFHLLTPIPATILEKCNGVVKGALQLPIQASVDHKEVNSHEAQAIRGVAGVPWRRVPYLDYEHSSALASGGSTIIDGYDGGNSGASSPSIGGGNSPLMGGQARVAIIGADSKSTRKNLGRKRLN